MTQNQSTFLVIKNRTHFIINSEVIPSKYASRIKNIILTDRNQVKIWNNKM